MTTTANWQAVIESALRSKFADCGHRVRGYTSMRLRTEKVRGVREVWSVCLACATDDDYRVNKDERPWRMRVETL